MTMEAQAALEYLTTYVWAILIIAIIILAMFELGAFNSLNWAPRAQPGSCSISRPGGPNTTTYITLKGVCNNEIPKFVLNSQAGGILMDKVRYTPLITSAGQNSITITGWALNTQPGADQYAFEYRPNLIQLDNIYPNVGAVWFHCGGCSSGIPDATVWVDGGQSYDFQCCTYPNLQPIAPDQWGFYALSYNGVTLTDYYIYQGQVSYYSTSAPVSSGASTGLGIPAYMAPAGAFCIGCLGWDGYISNVQMYSTALSVGSVQALYEEGIGGAPIDLQNLIGWWPLNGNANDYSGNGNSQQIPNPSQMSYTESWTNGYSLTNP